MLKFDRLMTAEMIKLRGLGFSQKEIADKLGVVPGTISYQLKRIKKIALKEGNTDIYDYYMQPLKQGKGETQ